MREFDIDLTEYINKGIVPNELRISKQPGLSDCKELVITPQGLKPRPAIFALDADYGVFADYPYPLLFNSINDILISTDSALFNYDSEEQIINNPAKELVDFTDFLIANSTNSMYEFTSIDGAYISPDGPTELTFTSLCKYNDAQCLGVNGDTVYWSKIGLVDFTIDHSNIAGKIRLPFPGEGLKIMQLSNHILCYGDEGVFALTPVQQPAGTWRKVNIPLLAGIGIKNAEAVCDVGDSHIFIGNDENLWKIDSELKITKLGYDYLIKELDTPHCVFVSHYNYTYIFDSSTCYIYTSDGLTRVQHYSRSFVPYYSDDYKIAGYPQVTEGYQDFEIVTLPIDFNLRAVKHIQALELDVQSDTDVECAIEWRRSFKEAFRSTNWVRVNDAGVVQLPCSGIDFKVKIRGTISDDFYLASLVAKIKYENKTTLRGKYAR